MAKSKNKYLFILALIGLVLFNCVPAKKFNTSKPETKQSDTIVIENDSLDYKIIITDVGFNGWLVTQRPRGFYTQKFLELQNQIYVTEYNNRFLNTNQYDRNLYPFEIEYDRKVDYGYEVNYLLYHYFLFFEEKYNQKLR